MYLIADGVGVVAGRGDQEIQRLHPGIAGALEHDIKEFPVGLGMQLIENDTVGVESVLVCHIRRQHLIGAIGREIGDLLLGFQDFHPFGKRRAEPHHIHRHIKHNTCLLTVTCTAVYFCTPFTVTACKIQRHSCCKF